jgi:glycosyltransferase involved in cell wall biosynthesis
VELTILLPCLNEAETVGVCVRKARGYLEKHDIHGEVVVADNGSIDGSRELALAAGARIVSVPTRGYGAALIAGISEANGEFVIMGDSDDSYDFTSLEPFVASLRSGAELVMGNRFQGGIEPNAMPKLHRYLGNPVLSRVGRLFFRSTIGDFHCGLRGFRRASILQLGLQSSGMEFASEMVVKATLHGLVIDEVPTVLHPDGRSRPPHLRSWRDGWRHLRFLLLYSPRWLFLYPGLLLMVLGLVVGARISLGSWRIGSTVLDVNSLVVCSAAVLIGHQSVWFGVLSKSFASREGLLPLDVRVDRLRTRFPLEAALLASLLFSLVGLGGLLVVALRWGQADFGRLDARSTLRILVPSTTLIVGAAQISLSSLMLSILALPSSRPVARAQDPAQDPGQ